MKFKIILLAAYFLFHCVNITAQKINLTNNGKSEYQIVIPASASKWDSLAASELQKYIEQISSARIPILKDNSPVGKKEIVLGLNNHSKNEEINSARLDEDGGARDPSQRGVVVP